MSEIKSLAAPKASFDRRAVVKGAAWSVPVIAAAIAAPAAAASVATATMAFATVGSVNFSGTPSRPGTAPTGIIIHNTPGAAIAAGTVVAITITPTAGYPAIGVESMTGGTVSVQPKYTGNVFTVSFTYPAAIPGGTNGSNQLLTFAYSHKAGNDKVTYSNYKVDVSVTLPTRTPALQATAYATLLPK